MPHYPFTDEQRATLDCVYRWLQIADREGYEVPTDPIGFRIYSQKSSLLNRLLAGKNPFPERPPKSYSYPWYSLLEDGEARGYMDVHREGLLQNELFADGPTRIAVNQSLWHIIEVVGENHYRVAYNLKEESVWDLRRLTDDEILALPTGKTNPTWDESKRAQWRLENRDNHWILILHKPGKNTKQDLST